MACKRILTVAVVTATALPCSAFVCQRAFADVDAKTVLTSTLENVSSVAEVSANVSVLQSKLDSILNQITTNNAKLLSLPSLTPAFVALQNENDQLNAVATALQDMLAKLKTGYTITGYTTSTDVSNLMTTGTITFTNPSDGTTATVKAEIPPALVKALSGTSLSGLPNSTSGGGMAASSNISDMPDMLTMLLQQLGAQLPSNQNPMAAIQRVLNDATASAGKSLGLNTPQNLCVLKGGKRPEPGSRTAVYDIAAGKVYMPDGSVLEAHSGMGKMMDNPDYVNQRSNGPTPPNVYNLSFRESLYYGVQALRMTPTDPGSMFGRDGILAHTKLVSGNNGSHGCVAFADYDAFLNAYRRGDVKKLVVVSRISDDQKVCRPAAYDSPTGEHPADKPAEPSSDAPSNTSA